jgi:hypothetical protein
MPEFANVRQKWVRVSESMMQETGGAERKGRKQMADGGWRMADGGWRMADNLDSE